MNQRVSAKRGAAASNGPLNNLKHKQIDWLIVTALFLASLNLRPAISSIAPVLEIIRSDLGMNASVASLLTSIPVLCMGFFSPISVRIGRRLGIERVIMWSLVLLSGSTLLRIVTHSAFFLLLTAMLAGVGIASMGPLLSGFIKRHFSRDIPMMIAVYAMALSLGAALGSSLSAPLQFKVHSWQTTLAFWAIPAIAAVPIWYRVVRRGRDTPTDTATISQSSKLPWGNKKVWLLTVHFGLMAMVFYSLMAWLPPIMESLGYSHLYAGNILTIFALVQIPSGLVLQWLLKCFPSRLVWLLAASLLQLIGLIFIFGSILPWLAALLCGFGSGMLFALGTLLPIDAASSPQEAASWAAMTQSGGYIIGAMGPILIGWINDFTQQFGLSIMGLIIVTLLLMMVQVLIIPRKVRRALESTT